MKVGPSSTTAASQHEGCSIINNISITTRRLEHQQQQQCHSMKVGASSTSTLGWKYSARSWHLNNIITKMKIFSTKLASQQHQHADGNIQH
jgi:hypothetical protein